MKKTTAKPKVAEMRPEYDFRGGVRGKYAKRFASGSNVILLDPDVAEVFPDAATVNAVLRVLAKLILRQRKKRRPTTPR
jgi:hypothetical protein